jgi:hypothetical protein
MSAPVSRQQLLAPTTAPALGAAGFAAATAEVQAYKEAQCAVQISTALLLLASESNASAISKIKSSLPAGAAGRARHGRARV